MATLASQDGAKKKRKAQRPLIAPALPLNLKPRSTPGGESMPPPFTNVELSTRPEETKAILLPVRGPGEVPATSYNSERQIDSGNADEPAVSAQEEQHQRHQSSAAPEVLAQDTEPAHDGETESRSVTPKANSRAAPSGTQSPALQPVQVGAYVNDVLSEESHSEPLGTLEVANTQSGLNAQAAAQSIPTAQPNNTIMPRRYFSGEAPIFDWADEMSEEMPPDTLHIPSVPHLPELSSDLNSAQDTNIQAVADAPALAPPTKPVFGSTFVPELQSDGIAETPNRGRYYLNNGCSYTLDFKAKYAEMNLSPSRPEKDTVPFANGHVHEALQAPTEQPLSDLVTHFTKLFETKEWADWTIQVVSLNASYPPVAYHAHGVVISRSPLLRSQMRTCLQTRTMTPVITLSPPRYIQPAAFEAALKYVYNDALLTPAECARYFSFDGTITDSTIKSYRMDFCFSYWLSGCLLGLTPVMDAGVELIYENLDWDTAELLVAAALDLKDSPETQTSSALANGATKTPSTPGPSTSPASTRTRDTSTGQVHTSTDMHSSQLINILIESLAHGRLQIDLKNFKIDTRPPDILRSYLPEVPKHDKISHLALASITFGSLPTSSLGTSKPQNRSSQPVLFSSTPENNNLKYCAAEKSLSAILLNLPFTELNQMFEGFMRSFAEEDVLDTFNKVIQERELRRKQVAGTDWYRSEVSLKRRHAEVDMAEELAYEGEQSRMMRRSYVGVLEGTP